MTSILFRIYTTNLKVVGALVERQLSALDQVDYAIASFGTNELV